METQTDEAKQVFMRGVANDLCWMNDEAWGKALMSVEEIIYSHAVGINSDNSAIHQWNRLQEHIKRPAELKATLRQEAARDIRISLRRDIRRELNTKMRMVKEETERPDAWREVVFTAIPKKSDKVGFRSMRYISLALQTAVRRERKPHETNILGYETRSTAGVTATLGQVLNKAAEWGVGGSVASADVEGAFHCIKLVDVERALLQKGVHSESVCSLLRESCDLKSRINLPFPVCSWCSARKRGRH